MTTTPITDPTSIQARLEELRAKRGTFTTPTGLPLPDVRPAPKTQHFRKGGVLAQAKELTLSDDAKQIDQLVDELPMSEAVRMWGKPQKDYKRTGDHSVLIRCPNPSHPDNNPSANCDLEQGLFHCFSCDAGGDKYTLAALHHGYGNDYQSGKNFVELKKKVATDLGYTITETGGRTVLTAPGIIPPQPAPQPVTFDQPNPQPDGLIHTDEGWLDPNTGELTPHQPQPTEPQPAVQPASVVQPTEFAPAPAPQTAPSPAAVSVPVPVSFDDVVVDEDRPTVRPKPQLDWLPLGKNRSFLDRYMECMTKRGYPDSFAFAGALTCLGFVGNRAIRLQNTEPLHSGLGLLTIAETGTGKSRALRDTQKVLEKVMPWHGAEMAMLAGGHIVPGHGVKVITGAGSGENLIRQFEDTVRVPNGSNADGTTHYEEQHYPVNGLISFEELSQLVGKSSMTGSTLRERVMNFLDGAYVVENSTNTQGTYKAIDPFAFIQTSVQPKLVSKLITENDEHSGFLNRFAIFTGDRKYNDPRDMTVIPLDPAIAALKELKAHWDSMGEVIVKYHPDALERMAEHLDNKIRPTQFEEEGLLSRLDILFWKLILLFCINEETTTVTVDIVDKAIHLHTYFIATYKYVSGELYDPSGEKPDDTEDKIVDRIKKIMEAKQAKGAQTPEEYGVTATEIRVGVKRHFAHFSSPAQALNRTIAGLVDIGILTKHQGQRAARYTTK